MNIVSTLYLNCLLKDKLFIPPRCLKSKDKIKESIENILRDKIEGKCIHEGYVMPNTTHIVEYEKLEVVKNVLSSGYLQTIVHFTADICNPSIGNVVDCNIKNIKFVNKIGLLGYIGPITIIVGREFHEGDLLKELLNIRVNDIVKVEIIAKQFSLNSTEIKVIARLWSDKYKSFIKKEYISSKLTLDEDDTEDVESSWNVDNHSEDITVNENVEWSENPEESEDEMEDMEDIENILTSPIIKNMNKILNADDIELEEDENSELEEEDSIPDSDVEEIENDEEEIENEKYED